jgi:DNA-binding transcriptional LysR family regulator
VETPDLNLLASLDVLLDEGSVAAAARRLGLSPSAMSRTLARLRDATGDPLLVRAGRGLVPTPRALELAKTVGRIVGEAEAVLRPAQGVDLAALERTFTLRTAEGFAETFGPALLLRVGAEASKVRLRFIQKPDRTSAPLRKGGVDLETGVVGEDTAPELLTQPLFRDRFVAVVRKGHALSRGTLTPTRYARASHVATSRRDAPGGPVDAALASLGLERQIGVFVGGFATALSLARRTELVATVPDRHTTALREGLRTLKLPLAIPEITVSLLWHPRLDADPAHRWLRECVKSVCGRA